MRKFLVYVLLALSICVQSVFAADTDLSTLANALYVEGATVNTGSTATLSLRMKNANAATISGFQGSIALPSGASYVSGSAAISTSRATASNFTLSVKGTTQLGVMCYSASSATFSGTSGEVATFKVKAPTTPGTYTIAVSGIVLTTKLGEEVEIAGPINTTLTVNQLITGITLSKTSLNLVKGSSETVTATVSPTNATNKNVQWTTSNSNVATVSNGEIKAVASGAATITCKATDGSNISATCTVTVTNPVTSITLDKTSLALTKGKSETLNVTYAPADADNMSVTWTSSNTAAATVDASGKVTAVATGSATITAKSANGKTATCAVTVTNPVTGITLDKTSLALIKGKSETLNVTYAPADADNMSVTWTSSNTAAATVDASGKVTAVATGSATITAKSANGKTATCAVTVTNPVTSITLDKTSLALTKGKTETLNVTYAPADADNMSVTWTSSNTAAATVDASGKVTAVATGSATITAKSANGKTATCAVTVTNPVTSITLDKTSLALTKGKSETLNVTYAPADADNMSVTWKSSNTAAATADASGKVTAVATGSATITAKSANGKTATCAVTVTNPVTSITLDKTSLALTKGKSETLNVTYAPADADNMSVTWTSSNTNAATVDASGKVTAVATGSATITAKSANGKTATCAVTVTNPVTSITLDKTSLALTKGKSETLNVTYAPADADNMSVTWTSSNTNAATVDASGKVTAVATGSATITAKSANGKTATCTVTVTNPVTSITLDKTSLALTKGKSETLNVTYAPADADNMSVTWSSSNTNAATVDASGKVTAVATGSATITAKSANGKTATCAVTVTTPVTGLSIDKTEETIEIGSTTTLTASTNADADNAAVTWSSSNEAIATVSSTGVVTAVAVGKATITATSASDATKTASCNITVTNLCVDGIYYVITSDTDKTVAVTYGTEDYNSYSGDVVIPEKVTIGGVTYDVTKIAKNAFSECSGLTKITIPASITAIEGDAFLHASNIKSVEISDLSAWMRIAHGNYAANPLNIGVTKLNLNGELVETLVVPQDITKILYNVFRGYKYLKTIIVHSGVTNFAKLAFNNASNLKDIYIQAVTAPGLSTESVFTSAPTVHVYSNSLSAYQASNWGKLFNISLTDDFDNPAAGQLSTIVGTNPIALKVSGDLNGTDIKYLRSLINDYQLTSLDLSDARIVAGGEAYDGEQYVENNTMGNEMFACSNLQSIVLPSTLQRMKYSCLRYTQLKELTIPASVTDIGESVCASALQFEKFIVEAGNTAYCAEDGVLYSKDKTTIVACPCARTGVFEIPNSVTEIFKGCFNNCRNLTSIIIPSDVTTIGNYGLGSCMGLTSLICKAITPPSLGKYIFKQLPQNTCILKVPYASLSNYRAADLWKDFATITSIEGWAESLTLDKTEASLLPYQTVKLTATTDVADLAIVWTSSDETVATVENGVVTAIKAGAATITATANDEGQAKATCTVTVGTPAAPANVELVDLGLPSGTLWASMNVGANSPEEAGGYYAWGEVQEKDTYIWATYKWCEGADNTFTKYCSTEESGIVDNKTQLDLADDAAYVNWGTDWVMPNKDQLEELLSYCEISKTEQNGSIGWRFSAINGNSIFIPAAGYNSGKEGISKVDRFWIPSNTLSEMPRYNYNMWVTPEGNVEVSYDGHSRTTGRTIRPVSATQQAIRVTSVTINQESTALTIGQEVQLTATLAPEDAWIKTYSWTSSDETVATVDAEGKVTAVAAGEATITATALDGSGKKAECTVHVHNLTITYNDNCTHTIACSACDYSVTEDCTDEDGICSVCGGTLYILGDANGDRKVNVGDLTAIASHILGTTPSNFSTGGADANEDGKINVGDLTTIAAWILNKPGSQSSPRGMNISIDEEVSVILDEITISPKGTALLPVRINLPIEFTGFQFDISLPSGIHIEQATMNDVNVEQITYLRAVETTNSRYRVLGYSATDESVQKADVGFLNLLLSADQDILVGEYSISLDNAYVSDALQTISLLDSTSSMHVERASQIEFIVAEGELITVYDTAGRLLMRGAKADKLNDLSKGLYIVNGQIITIK